MQYQEKLYLVNQIQGADEIGNDVTASGTLELCYAKAQSVRTNEFYSATEVGLTPSMEFVVKRLNYNGQDEVEWNGTRYSVIRTIDPKSKFDIVLVCSKKIGITKKAKPSA